MCLAESILHDLAVGYAAQEERRVERLGVGESRVEVMSLQDRKRDMHGDKASFC